GAEVEHVGVLQIFRDGADDFAFVQVRGDRSPRAPVVGAGVDVGAVVAGAVRVERGVDGRLIELGRLDLRHIRPFGRVGNLRRDVGPGGAPVFADVELAVVGAGIEQARLLPRFGDGEEGGVAIDAVVLRDLDVFELGTEQLERVAIDTGREVRADRLPRMAPVG